MLIAHRGEPESWPENSLTGYRAVLEAGARLLETDVQFTADRVPVLLHDPTLLRMTGHELVVTQTRYDTLRGLPAGEPEKFGDRFQDLSIARLDEFVALLQEWPEARAFVEIKRASLDVFGTACVVDTMLATLQPVIQQCVLISFDLPALQYARERNEIALGWVLQEWSEESRASADRLGPQYLFVNRKRLPAAAALWDGPWQWVIYTLNTAQEVRSCLERGAHMVETNVISRLLHDPGLGGAGDD